MQSDGVKMVKVVWLQASNMIKDGRSYKRGIGEEDIMPIGMFNRLKACGQVRLADDQENTVVIMPGDLEDWEDE